MLKKACNEFFSVLIRGMANTVDVTLYAGWIDSTGTSGASDASGTLPEISPYVFQGSIGVGYWVTVTANAGPPDEYTLTFEFETLNGTAQAFDVGFPPNGGTPVSFSDPAYEGAAADATFNIEPTPPEPPTPTTDGPKRGDIPTSDKELIPWAKAFAATAGSEALDDAIAEAETAKALADAPSTNTIVSREAARTAFLELRKNLKNLIPISTTRSKRKKKQFTDKAPKVSLLDNQPDYIFLGIAKAPDIDRMWLHVEVWDTKNTNDEDANVLEYNLTAFPYVLDLKNDMNGHTFNGIKTVYIRSQWRGLNKRGAWAGPWSEWITVNLIIVPADD